MSRRCGQVRRSRRCGRFGVPEPSGRLHLDTAIRVSNSLVDFIFSHPSLAVSKEKGIWQNAASGPLAKEKKPLFSLDLSTGVRAVRGGACDASDYDKFAPLF